MGGRISARRIGAVTRSSAVVAGKDLAHETGEDAVGLSGAKATDRVPRLADHRRMRQSAGRSGGGVPQRAAGLGHGPGGAGEDIQNTLYRDRAPATSAHLGSGAG